MSKVKNVELKVELYANGFDKFPKPRSAVNFGGLIRLNTKLRRSQSNQMTNNAAKPTAIYLTADLKFREIWDKFIGLSISVAGKLIQVARLHPVNYNCSCPCFILDRQLMKKIRTRIARSPTGSPHIGTAYAALFNYVFARQNKGEFILRIEDTDRSRFVESSEKEIFEALHWLNLEPDESPEKAGKFGPYRQSERLETYQEAALNLVKAGKAYFCTCSADRLEKLREEQKQRQELPHYDRKCRYESQHRREGSVVRLAVPLDGETVVNDLIRGRVKFENKILDDQVLLKSDGFPTYHLASVVDDHLMEISHVIRAEEWLSSTPKHLLIYQAFGWEQPEFAHLPLLRNRDKSKISKRKNPVAIGFYRGEGYLPEALLNFLGLMGWSMPNDQEIFSLDEMIKSFKFARIGTVGPVFDTQKLDWLNGEYIRAKSDKSLCDYLIAEGITKLSEEQVLQALPLVKERIKKLGEFDALVGYFFSEPRQLAKELLVQKGKSSKETTQVLEKVALALQNSNWDKNSIETSVRREQQNLGWSNSDLFMTIRVAVSSSTTTPPLFDTLEIIGKKGVIRRLKKAALELSK